MIHSHCGQPLKYIGKDNARPQPFHLWRCLKCGRRFYQGVRMKGMGTATKVIRLHEDAYIRLQKYKKPGESFQAAVERLLDEAEDFLHGAKSPSIRKGKE